MPKGEYLQYGGQAVIEGVMMRSPKFYAVACRAPNGRIVLHSDAVAKTWIGRQKWLKAPFLRGTLALLDAMAIGIRALNFSAKIQMDEQYQEEGEDAGEGTAAKDGGSEAALKPAAVAEQPEESPEETETAEEVVERSEEGSEVVRAGSEGGDSIMKAAVAGTMIIGLGFGVLLFIASPVWVAELFKRMGVENDTVLNMFEGIIKIGFFLGYVALIGLMKDIREVFKYHGAEHKAINTLEAGQPLTVESTKSQTRLHPRCGTSFAIIVLILLISVATFLPRDYGTGVTALDLTLRVCVKLLILPFIAGISYETIRLAGRFRSNRLFQGLVWPGLKTQYLTTREPDEGQIEVALVALRTVLKREEEADRAADDRKEVTASAQPSAQAG
ncbi:MAG: DUF1385 domain-containing protein [Armatimonadetes bacterium]|nr:DUF1385 domain-containing protein [Armatimonadota bacterium]